ncbi:MAG: DUF4367 domain-containing protein [Clostridiales bacterium]|nr:DUF4367 domain-containing protein [Clostridiales bacterium]
MDGKQSPELAQILKAIKEGGYGKDEWIRRLNALVDRELLQMDRPADMELVRACQDMLYRLHHDGTAYESNHTEAIKKAKAKLRSPWHEMNRFHPLIRVAAVLIFMTIGFLFYDLLICREPLDSISTPDEQQFIVNGNTTENEVTPHGSADGERQPGTIITTDLTEAVTAFGYHPALPTWLPEGWEVDNYAVITSNHASDFYVQYTNDTLSMKMRLKIVEYERKEIAQSVIEQNNHGYSINLSGTKIYVTENIDSTVAMWLTDHLCYSLSGPLPVNEIINIAESILQEVRK